MSEFANVNLVLGIIGTITGFIALFISWWTHSQEKPILKAKIKSLTHEQPSNSPSVIAFQLEYFLSNKGNRPTTLNEIELKFAYNDKKYSIKEPLRDKLHYDGMSPLRLQAEACKTFEDYYKFSFYSQEIKEQLQKIPCTFYIYHTHKVYKFSAISTLIEMPQQTKNNIKNGKPRK